MTTSTTSTEAAANPAVGTATPASIPEAVESAEGKLVYYALATTGECTVDDLAEPLDLPRITLYGVLDTLTSRGVVERLGAGRFAPAS